MPISDVEEAGEADEGPATAKQRGRVAEAHVVTEEDAATSRFSIDQVVLPLPGCRIHYPRHETAQVVSQSVFLDMSCLFPKSLADSGLLLGSMRLVLYVRMVSIQMYAVSNTNCCFLGYKGHASAAECSLRGPLNACVGVLAFPSSFGQGGAWCARLLCIPAPSQILLVDTIILSDCFNAGVQKSSCRGWHLPRQLATWSARLLSDSAAGGIPAAAASAARPKLAPAPLQGP